MNSTFISIGELARLTGLSTHTLRFYEAAGVLKPAERLTNGHRRYHHDDVLWLEFVLRLKATGMPLADIAQYAQLRARGEMTLSPRLAMLELHRKRLLARMTELSQCAQVLDDKIHHYRKLIVRSKARKKQVKS